MKQTLKLMPVKNKLKKGLLLPLILLCCLMTAPFSSGAFQYFLATTCYYTTNGVTFIKVDIDPSGYNGMVSMFAPNSLDVALNVYQGSTMTTFHGTHTGSTYVYNVGSMTGPFDIEPVYEEYDVNPPHSLLTTVTGDRYTVSSACSFSQPERFTSWGCYRNTAGAKTVGVSIAQNVALWAASHGYVVQLVIFEPGYTPSATFNSTNTLNGATTTLNYNITGTTIHPDKFCYHAALKVIDPNDPSFTPVFTDDEFMICMCYDVPDDTHNGDTDPWTMACSADFTATLGITGTSATITLTTLGGSVSSEEYQISGPLNMTLTAPATIIGPIGTYTICHIVHNGSGECSTCQTVCISNGGDGEHKGVNPSANTVGTVQSAAGKVSLFPNPTNDLATAKIVLAKDAMVSLEVSDAAGRIISTVASAKMEAGEHKINIATDKLAPGIYNVKIITDKTSVTQRLSVVK